MSDEVYKNCAQQSCGSGEEAAKHYFYKGRYPSGTHLPRERLRFVKFVVNT